MVESLFTKAHIDSMRPQIQKTVDSLLDEMIKKGGSEPVDLVEKFALPVPSYVPSLFPASKLLLTYPRPSTAFLACLSPTCQPSPTSQLSVATAQQQRPKHQTPTMNCSNTWRVLSTNGFLLQRRISSVSSLANSSSLVT